MELDEPIGQLNRKGSRLSNFRGRFCRETPNAFGEFPKFLTTDGQLVAKGIRTAESLFGFAKDMDVPQREELRQVLVREVGAISAVLVGAAPLPKLLKEGKPHPVARKWFLTMPLTHTIAAADLPLYLRETALYLQTHPPNTPNL